MTKRELHDGIIGLILTVTVGLGFYGDPLWLLIPAVLGLTLLQSAFTGFCPLYYTLDRLYPGE